MKYGVTLPLDHIETSELNLCLGFRGANPIQSDPVRFYAQNLGGPYRLDHNPSSALMRWTLCREMPRDLAIDVRDDPAVIMLLMTSRSIESLAV